MASSSEITFDIVVSGCATDCWHCYVDGGRGSFMEYHVYEQAIAYVNDFRRIAESRDIEVYPYLDLEPMLHPRIADIVSTFVHVTGLSLPECMPTTGVPLARRRDWEAVLTAYWEAGVREFELTLHGPEELHDRVVSAQGALACHISALRRLHQSGFGTRLNLMVSKPMLRQFDETMTIVKSNQYDKKRAVIPLYVPNRKLRQFEEHRPELRDVAEYAEYFEAFCDNKEREGGYWKRIAQSTEASIYASLISGKNNHDSYQLLIESLPNWRFLTVGPNLDVWYGNGFHRTKKIGSIGSTTPEELLELALKEYPNYSLGGFFPIDDLPSPNEVANAVADPNGQRIYHEHDELHAKWLDDYLHITSVDRKNGI